jgi:hypothetical protein
MRKRYRVLLFAALVAALVVPVGYALSVESTPIATHARYVAPAALAAVVPVAAVAVAAPRTLHVNSTEPVTLRPLSDAAKLFGIGTLLFGLAAFVRKAI